MKEKNRKELEKLCEVIRQTVPTLQIYLFGSYAYGEPNEDSDYDLYVVISDDGPRPLAAAAKIRRAVLPFQTRPLDVLADRQNSFQNRKSVCTLERDIFQKGVLLYEQRGFEQGVV